MGQRGAQPLGAAPHVLLHRHGDQGRVEGLSRLAQGPVSGQEHAGHPVPGGHPAVDQEFRAGPAVDGDAVHHPAVDGVAEGVALLRRGVVVAHKEGRVKALVQALHHHLRSVAPAADKLDILGQLLGQDVEPRPVGVLHHHQVGPGGPGPLGGGHHLRRHLPAAALVLKLPRAAPLPGGGDGGTLDVRADEYFHGYAPPLPPILPRFPPGHNSLSPRTGGGSGETPSLFSLPINRRAQFYATIMSAE